MHDQTQAPDDTAYSTILVVEDDLSIQSLLNDILLSEGYRVVLASNGAEGLEALDADVVDLMLLDIMLPDINGHEVARRARESTFAELPIIMLTARAQPHQIVRGLSEVDDYVTKPFFPKELLQRIRNLLRRHRSTRDLAEENAALQDMLDLTRRELEATREESHAEALLRQELLHNMTTHLKSLSGIVDAELRKLPPGLERESVQRIRGRVRGAALVYQVSEMLRVEPVAFGEVIRTTAAALKSIYRPWKRIVVSVEGGDAALPSAIAAPLMMVANELITNCFKHAFPENRFGAIDVVYELDDQAIRLEIRDDGVGIGGSSAGNGRSVVSQLIRGLGGSIEYRGVEQGTQVQIIVPLPAAHEPATSTALVAGEG